MTMCEYCHTMPVDFKNVLMFLVGLSCERNRVTAVNQLKPERKS